MKARMFTLLTLILGLSLLSASAEVAHTSELGTLSERHGLSLPTILDWDGASSLHSLPAGANGVRAQGMGASVALGDPGLSFRYVKTFGVTEVAWLADSDHLNGPNGLGLDGANNLWVAEGVGYRVLKYSSVGTFQMSIGTAGLRIAGRDLLATPWDVGIDPIGNIWVVDGDADRVVKFAPDGTYLDQIGVNWEEGTDNDHLHNPGGVALDTAGNIYISDGGNNRIQIFDSSGVYSTTLGESGVSGSDNTHFSWTDGLTVDSNGTIYVADQNNHRVQIFDSTGTYSATLGNGTCGIANDQLCSPGDVAVDSSSNIYVADTNNHRVQLFDISLKYVATLGQTGVSGSDNAHFNRPEGVAVDSNGSIYVSDPGNFRVQKFNSSHFYQYTIGTTGVPYVTDNLHFNAAYGVAVDSSGNIILTEEWGHRLLKLNSSGVAQWSLGDAGVTGSDNAHFARPRGTAVDSNRNIYVAEHDNHRVQIYDSAGNYVATVGTGWGNGDYHFKNPSGVAIGPDGYIYVADTWNHRIQIYNSSRIYVATLGVTGSSGTDNAHFNGPHGVFVDSNGNIYVPDSYNRRVQVFDSNRVYQRTIGTTGEEGDDFSHFDEPRDVAVDSYGNVYVADAWNNRVQVFDSGGAYLTTIGGGWGRKNGQLRGAMGVEVDSRGNVYVADEDNHRIQKFAPGVPGWRQVNINGFGERRNRGVTALAVFNGRLYASASNQDDGARVWRTADGTTWTAVSEIGFGSAYTNTNRSIPDLTVFDGQLYAGVGRSDNAGQIWRSSDGTAWTQVEGSGFGNANNSRILALAVFSHQLYAATGNDNDGLEIWRSSTGNAGSWSQVVTGGFNSDSNNRMVCGFAEFNGYLYAAVENTTDGVEIWRTSDGVTWTQANTSSFGDANNGETGGLAVFGGYLYSGTRNDTTGAQLWRSSDGTTWTQVVGDGFGDVNNRKLESLVVFNGGLYAVAGNYVTGMTVWRSVDGITWTQVNPDGFGDSNNDATLWGNATAAFNGSLYIGTWNWGGNGGEVWMMLHQVYLPTVLRDYSSATPYAQATFDGPTCEWLEGETSLFKYGCFDGEYQQLIKVANQNLYYIGYNLPSADFALSADLRFVSSVYGLAALIFDVNATHEFYMFTLSSSGSYGLWTHGAGWKQLVGWTSAPGFDASGANSMKVEREGPAIGLYLNDQHLITVDDTTLTGELGVGVYIQNQSQPGLDVRWDNFVAYPLEGAL